MMPIFRQDLERRESASGAGSDSRTGLGPGLPIANSAEHQLDGLRQNDGCLSRKPSEESIRTEFCDGPLPEGLNPKTPEQEKITTTTCSDRAELIERLKKGESPTWVPNRFVRTRSPPEDRSLGNGSLTSADQFDSVWNQPPITPTRSPTDRPSDPSTLVQPSDVTPDKGEPEPGDDARLENGLSIERPRSALHSGDFTQDDPSRDEGLEEEDKRAVHQDALSSGSQPWFATTPPRDFVPFRLGGREPPVRPSVTTSSLSSLASSVSSSFIYKPPTSPLVQSESNEDLDLTSPMDGIDISSSHSRNTRRHTLMSSHSESFGSPTNFLPGQLPSLRQERTFPYQAHQPRRSLTSAPNLSMMTSSPQVSAFSPSRRTSYSSEASPIQHASMVGSYEESILRGRMSAAPSKPLEFLAQIGVLGLGKCKTSLRCPAHVTLPFPAVFYSYPSSSNGPFKMEDGPSPYVGQVDLENGLPNPEDEARSKRKKQSRVTERRQAGEQAGDDGFDGDDRPMETSDHETRKTQRRGRRSASPRAPPGGSYRIPERGQIQIIIKNPNKTAVKLFLVPYDLAGMEPGTKTFIRQRSYSTGPIIENLPQSKQSESSDRPILRYLVHLHICCPSRGRYYLYKSIRVVFANRVPDGKEKLRNEITLPEPRFTSYKPIRVMLPPTLGGTGPGASLAAEKAFRRRSSGFYFGGPQQPSEGMDRLSTPNLPRHSYSFDFARDSLPVEPIPFKLSHGSRPESDIQDSSGNIGGYGSANNGYEPGGSAGFLGSPDSSQTSRPTTQGSSNASTVGAATSAFDDKYDKLSKGDAGYGGPAFSFASSALGNSRSAPESLLSQRLRTLGVQGSPVAAATTTPPAAPDDTTRTTSPMDDN